MTWCVLSPSISEQANSLKGAYRPRQGQMRFTELWLALFSILFLLHIS